MSELAKFEHRGHKVVVQYGGTPLTGGDGLDGKCVFFCSARGLVWISGELRRDSPEFYNTLAHEMVHLAGCILHEEGASADPLGEQLPDLVGELVEKALASLPKPGEPETFWEQVEAYGDLLDETDGVDGSGADDAQAALEF